MGAGDPNTRGWNLTFLCSAASAANSENGMGVDPRKLSLARLNSIVNLASHAERTPIVPLDHGGDKFAAHSGFVAGTDIGGIVVLLRSDHLRILPIRSVIQDRSIAIERYDEEERGGRCRCVSSQYQ